MSFHFPFASSSAAGRGLLAAALAAGLAAASPAFAFWIDDGVPVCTASAEQRHPVLVPTLNGGVIIVWWDARNGSLGIYAQRLDADGNPLWATNGVQVGEIMSASVDRPVAVPDGIGGVYVIWASTGIEINFERLIAQRIGPDGSRLWAPGGVVVCLANSDQTGPVGVSDLLPANFFRQPGIIVAWEGDRAGAFGIYAQRLDQNGVRVWGDLGVRLSNQGGDVAGNPVICPDGTNTPLLAGGAIVAWTRLGSETDIHANRVDRAGAVQWGTNGVAVCTAAGEQISPAITGPHGSRTAFIAWSDGRNPTNTDIYAQRIVDGTPSWAANGIPVCNAAGDQSDPVMANAAIGAFVVWEDGRDPNDGDLYAQRVDQNGIPQWAANGVPVCSALGNQFRATIVVDGQGGAFVAWVDQRGDDFDIYAQRMNENGKLLWQADGVRVCGAIDDQDESEMVWDGTWLSLTWEDLRSIFNNNN